MKFSTIAFASVLTNAAAHVTLNPNYGAGAGNYFKTSIKVSHGTHGKETTKIKIDIPHGVLSAVPEALHGWDIEVTTREITPYISHGNTVSTGPASVTWTATCTGDGAPDSCDNADHAGLDNAHLLELEMQMKVGCDFGADKDGAATDDTSIWLDQYTLWFRTSQWVSDPGTNNGNTNDGDMLPWIGTVSGSESWGAALPKPSPYIFIHSTEKCTQDDSTGGDEQLGMRWGSPAEVIKPAENQEAVKNTEQVLALIEEESLSLKEEMDVRMSKIEADSTKKTSDANDKTRFAEGVAVIAMAISGVVLTVMLTMAGFRAARPSEFRRALLAYDSTEVPKAEWNDKELDNNL